MFCSDRHLENLQRVVAQKLRPWANERISVSDGFVMTCGSLVLREKPVKPETDIDLILVQPNLAGASGVSDMQVSLKAVGDSIRAEQRVLPVFISQGRNVVYFVEEARRQAIECGLDDIIPIHVLCYRNLHDFFRFQFTPIAVDMLSKGVVLGKSENWRQILIPEICRSYFPDLSEGIEQRFVGLRHKQVSGLMQRLLTVGLEMRAAKPPTKRELMVGELQRAVFELEMNIGFLSERFNQRSFVSAVKGVVLTMRDCIEPTWSEVLVELLGEPGRSLAEEFDVFDRMLYGEEVPSSDLSRPVMKLLALLRPSDV